LPEDRIPGASKAAKQRHVKIVKVPCDDKQPLTELTIPVDEGRPGDQLPSLLKIYFNQGKVRVDDVKDAAGKQFTNQDVSISQSTIDKLSDVGSVEVFPLAHANEHNDNCKVAFYLDEVGQLKKLPPNPRASRFAELCGFQNVPFVGDMFIGRVGPPVDGSSNTPQNIDFTLAEFTSDAPWLKNVVQHNYQAGIAANKVAMEADLPSTESTPEAEVAGGAAKWSETKETVEVSVQIPTEIKKFTAKDIAVKFGASSVSVKVRNTTAEAITHNTSTVPPQEFAVLLEGPLAGSVVTDECTWSISGHSIELALEKSGKSQGLWRKLLA
jgi:hypothetical protein